MKLTQTPPARLLRTSPKTNPFIQNPRYHPTASALEVTIARAKRLVVVSAGSFGSPTILERSGIGATKVLEKYGVEQVVDLPGVGENYQGTFILSQRDISFADDKHMARPPDNVHSLPC